MKKIVYQNLYTLLSALSGRINNRYVNRYKIAIGTALLLLSSGFQPRKKDNATEETKDTITTDSAQNKQVIEEDILCYDSVINPGGNSEFILPPPPDEPVPVLCYEVHAMPDSTQMVPEPPVIVPEEPQTNMTCYDMPIQPDCYAVTIENDSLRLDSIDEDKVHIFTEKMPEFPGGSGKLMEYIAQNLRFPEGYDHSFHGRVIIEMIIEKDGSVSNPKVIRSLDTPLDTAALKVVEGLPNFEPGIQNGKPVRVKYVIPLSFRYE